MSNRLFLEIQIPVQKSDRNFTTQQPSEGSPIPKKTLDRTLRQSRGLTENSEQGLVRVTRVAAV